MHCALGTDSVAANPTPEQALLLLALASAASGASLGTYCSSNSYTSSTSAPALTLGVRHLARRCGTADGDPFN